MADRQHQLGPPKETEEKTSNILARSMKRKQGAVHSVAPPTSADLDNPNCISSDLSEKGTDKAAKKALLSTLGVLQENVPKPGESAKRDTSTKAFDYPSELQLMHRQNNIIHDLHRKLEFLSNGNSDLRMKNNGLESQLKCILLQNQWLSEQEKSFGLSQVNNAGGTATVGDQLQLDHDDTTAPSGAITGDPPMIIQRLLSRNDASSTDNDTSPSMSSSKEASNHEQKDKKQHDRKNSSND